MSSNQKSIEQKFRKLSDIEHVLLRPGMYVGSTKIRDDEVWLLSDEKSLVKRKVTYNPAFLKIFDEIVSNSVDEHRRNPKLNEIRVKIDAEKGSISVWDNGGIPVVIHADHGEWIPEMIFSNLKAGSNFNDDEERLVAGTNGVGSTLTNIFSTTFRIRTCDGSNAFEQVFSQNMRDRTEPKIVKWKENFTEIFFIPDVSRFDMTAIDEDHVQMMRKRCLDLSACNPKLKIKFNNEIFKFTSFKEYCALFSDKVVYEEIDRWRIGFLPSNGSFEQVSFVNAVETRDGGTHVDYVTQQAVEWIRERVRKKHKVDLRPSEIRNHFFVLVQSDIVNPAFSSQTKEKLITEPRDFGSKCEISDKMLKLIFESEVVQRILDWAQQKALADERKQLRELNKNLAKGKVLKLIDAKARAMRHNCTLALFEGDSASSAFRKYRNPDSQGAFPLRGKFVNVAEVPSAKVIQNQEVKDLLTAIGLRMGEEPKDLRYGKVLIYSDADPDGDSIAGLLINFFGRYWPEMFAQGRICRVMTPLVVAKKKDQKMWFYTSAEFDAWQSKQKDIDKWDIAYKKGLAALEDDEYREIIQNPNLFEVRLEQNYKKILDAWFGPDPSIRKIKIMGTQNNNEADDERSDAGREEDTTAVA
jgi:DNA topoisomerase-2